MRPPRIAERLVGTAASPRDRECLLADLAEEFERVVEQHGRRAAARWYWRQTLSSVCPLVVERTARAVRTVPRPRARASGLTSDVVHAWRRAARHPAIALGAVATLSVAFATAVAALTVVNAVVVRPLPFPDAGQLVEVRVGGPALPRSVRSTSRPNFEDWRRLSRSFAALGAYAPASFRLTNRGEPVEIDALRVSEDFHTVLGSRPQAGRLLQAEDFEQGAAVAVLTASYWRREFGGDPAAVGRHLVLDGRSYEIVGVLPDLDVSYPAERHAAWVPLVPAPAAFWERSRESGWLFVVGRLRDGISIPAAAAEMTSVAAALSSQYPEANRDRTEPELTPVRDVVVGPVRPVLTLLAASLAMVLLVGGGNVAMLLLAAASGRRREFAVRTAVGAGGDRLTRQIAIETGLLTFLAAGVATWLSPVFVRAFVASYPTTLPRSVPAGADAMTVGLLVLLAMGSAVLLSVPQAARARAASVSSDLSSSSRTTEPRADRAARSVLVAVQAAVSFCLIVAGTGLVRTLDRLVHVDPGYRSANTLTFTLAPPPSARSGQAVMQFYDAVLESIRTVPGVTSAASGVGVPMTSGGWAFGIRPSGRGADVLVGVNLTTGGYFDALGIPLLEGRLLTPVEQRSAADLAIVNEPLARLLGGGAGTTLEYSGTRWRIVGVVAGVRQRSPRTVPAPELFIPWHMSGLRPQALVVRCSTDPLRALPAIAARIRAIDPTVPLGDVARLEDRLERAVSSERFRATLVGFLSIVAIALAAFGAYSVTACTAARRFREYGIRLALGEPRASIGRRILASALVPTAAGIAGGLIGALGTGRWLDGLLFDVSASDPRTMAAAGVILVLLSLLSAAGSARRAASMDPMTALTRD